MVYKPATAKSSAKSSDTSSSKSKKTNDKTVKFALTQNVIQDEKDYEETLKTRPELPFDSERQPEHSIFKNKGMRSPINRYYKFTDYWDQLYGH
ncbi:hypothetical protein LSTR_LSTR014702 [Laodelphax striatellus]|uniref:Uncharacterized protein n=1 Tax=Laodelphax striatellus TaxID=195883 RepID=A0A482XBY6_LAOST|nr:hypothetical protein LSTR_LSTR014702 [Laodelphax striatellus]